MYLVYSSLSINNKIMIYFVSDSKLYIYKQIHLFLNFTNRDHLSKAETLLKGRFLIYNTRCSKIIVWFRIYVRCAALVDCRSRSINFGSSLQNNRSYKKAVLYEKRFYVSLRDIHMIIFLWRYSIWFVFEIQSADYRVITNVEFCARIYISWI